MNWGAISTVVIVAADAATIARALLRPHREPASRLAWIIAVLALPIGGVILYLLLGETRISGKRRERGKEVESRLPRPPGNHECKSDESCAAHWAPFALARTVNHLDPTSGNSARLARDSYSAIDEMIADVEAARECVHGCFYIWLADNNGLKLKDAFIRAAKRGVQVRLLADALGSRMLIRSGHWREMRESGCQVRVALPVGNPLWTQTRGRVDLRNHRKLMVVDNRIAWCGSQNCADPQFRIKSRYAPWIDIMSRWEGPVAIHCQYLFVSDWISEGGDDISCAAQQTAAGGAWSGRWAGPRNGPDRRICRDARLFCRADPLRARGAGRDDALLRPRRAAALRADFGRPAPRADGDAVPETERQLDRRRREPQLLQGFDRCRRGDLRVRPGLLHAKTMVVDRRVGLIGSANLDRRSFELNFENNILFDDPSFADEVRARQDEYLAQCDRVSREEVADYGLVRRLWQNLLATLSPML